MDSTSHLHTHFIANDSYYYEYFIFVHQILAPLPGSCLFLWKLIFCLNWFYFLLVIFFLQFLFLCWSHKKKKRKKKKGFCCFSWVCCKIWKKNQSPLVRSIAHQLRSSALTHIIARSLCTCAPHFCSYEWAHTPYASTLYRRSPTLKRTRVEGSIIIASSVLVLNQL